VWQDRHFLPGLREQFEDFMKRSAQAWVDAHILQRELAAEVLRSSGSLRLRVTGWSMLPTVWPGDTLLIERVSSEDIFAGDIVLFSSGRRFVAHRVVAIGDDAGVSRVHTQGDAVPRRDAPLPASGLLGKVSFIQRGGQWIEPSRFLRFSERAVAAGFRCSPFAARVVVRVHGMLQKLHSPSSVSTSRFHTASFQNIY
jgi:signal peptidase I